MSADELPDTLPAGRKDDQGKLRWGLLRKSLVVCLEAVIRVLMFGAKKYGDENWQRVENPKVRYRDALDRHLAEIDKGVMVDPDTGEHHMAHVATNALFLLWFYLTDVSRPYKKRESGWRRWMGGTSAAPPEEARGLDRVEVELRNGHKFRVHPGGVSWGWGGGPGLGDIVAWRPAPSYSYTSDPYGEAGR